MRFKSFTKPWTLITTGLCPDSRWKFGTNAMSISFAGRGDKKSLGS